MITCRVKDALANHRNSRLAGWSSGAAKRHGVNKPNRDELKNEFFQQLLEKEMSGKTTQSGDLLLEQSGSLLNFRDSFGLVFALTRRVDALEVARERLSKVRDCCPVQ